MICCTASASNCSTESTEQAEGHISPSRTCSAARAMHFRKRSSQRPRIRGDLLQRRCVSRPIYARPWYRCAASDPHLPCARFEKLICTQAIGRRLQEELARAPSPLPPPEVAAAEIALTVEDSAGVGSSLDGVRLAFPAEEIGRFRLHSFWSTWAAMRRGWMRVQETWVS